MTTSDKVIREAQKHLNQSGTTFQKWYGTKGPWSAMFVSYCFSTAGVPLAGSTAKGFASCSVGATRLKKADQWTDKPKRGDLVFFDWPQAEGKWNHIGLITKVRPDGSLETIEGNVDGKVKAMIRKVDKKVLGYGRPAYGASTKAAETSVDMECGDLTEAFAKGELKAAADRPRSREVAGILAYLDKSGVKYRPTSTNAPRPDTPYSNHVQAGTDGIGLAVDAANGFGDHTHDAIFDAMLPVASKLSELIYSKPGRVERCVKNGKFVDGRKDYAKVLKIHHNHVHIAVPRGVFLSDVATGKPPVKDQPDNSAPVTPPPLITPTPSPDVKPGPTAPPAGTSYVVTGAFEKKWNVINRAIGSPTTDAFPGARGGMCQHFERGSMLATAQGAPFVVVGKIRAAYESAGWESGVYGYPTSDELATQNNAGQVSHFENGSILWSGPTNAHGVVGDIRKKYEELGWNTNLGFPVTDQVKGARDGFFQHFEHASIFWTPTYGAKEVHGAIRTKYQDWGWESGVLGYPGTDEIGSFDNKARETRFEYGTIIWHPETGCFEMHGEIGAKYEAMNRAFGPPTTDEVTPGNGGVFQHFRNGSIFYKGGLGAHEVHGAIRSAYEQRSWESGPLGYPTSDEQVLPNNQGWRNDFEHGWIQCSSNGQITSSHPPVQVVAPVLSGGSNIEMSFRFFVAKGLSAAQSAGIVGNFEAESGVNPRSHEKGHTAEGRGIAQWGVNVRWASLERFAAARGLDKWALDTQLQFTWEELTSSRRGALSELRQKTTPEDAAVSFCWSFEQPLAGPTARVEERKKNARRIYQQFA